MFIFVHISRAVCSVLLDGHSTFLLKAPDLSKSLQKCLKTSREAMEPAVAVAKCYIVLFESSNIQRKFKPMEQTSQWSGSSKFSGLVQTCCREAYVTSVPLLLHLARRKPTTSHD